MVLNLTSDRKMETTMVTEATIEMVPVIMGETMSESCWGCDKEVMAMVIMFVVLVGFLFAKTQKKYCE